VKSTHNRNGCHQTETEETTVANDHWPSHGLDESDFDVPEALLWKPSAGRECLDALAAALERLPLDPYRLDSRAYIRVP
jgi:hypothetical protein